jgi:acyl-CoA hydrolase
MARAGSVIAYLDGPDSARVAPAEVARLTDLDTYEVLLGWTPEERMWLDDPSVTGRTFIAGYAQASAVRAGRLRYVPVRLSAVPRFLERERIDVAVVTGVRRGTGYAYRGSVGWGPDAVRTATRVVVEVDESAFDLGAPKIDGNIVATVRRDGGAITAAPRDNDAIDRAIGNVVASLLPDDATIQFGPGGIAEAIVAGIDRPVHIFSGLLTESAAELADRDLLAGTVTAGYVWGDIAITRLARSGRLAIAPVAVTHDISALGAIPRFVACNTALQVGLDGAVNVERVGGRIIAGIGGHADFCAGASHCDDGLSIIALRSTDRTGRSTIVPRVDVVSTPRCDVDVVVTEHGIADLRGLDDEDRTARLVSVAAPEHRHTLGTRPG